jgi:hypothetical protein
MITLCYMQGTLQILYYYKIYRTWKVRVVLLKITQHLLSAQVIFRIVFLVAIRTVWPRQGRASDVLLAVKKTPV